jgi:D-alanyl-D-alanine carboxypeptidase
MIDPYQDRVQRTLVELGIDSVRIGQRGLILHHEPDTLVTVPTPGMERDFMLTPEASSAWLAMQDAARSQGVPLALVSAFRSFERQREIIQAKRLQGQSMDTILVSVAPPGYSEHHTGRAIDIGSSEAEALEEVFEQTPSFAWLMDHAKTFEFTLSFPRNNPQGYVFEPWHWCYRGVDS